MTRLMSTLLLAVLFVGTTGCASYSEDRATYHSTYMSPKTVLVVDVLTEETVWSYDVPPNHVLMVEFDVGTGRLESIRQERGEPTRMEWALYHETAGRSLLRKQHFRGSSIERGVHALEGRPVRLEMTVGRPVGPEAFGPAPRSIEDIERDLLPEPDGPEDAVDDAAEDVEDAVEEATEEAVEE
ncbi:hypothetical protein OT109_11180 [Phycisphaeraceae bacterium D3-23]